MFMSPKASKKEFNSFMNNKEKATPIKSPQKKDDSRVSIGKKSPSRNTDKKIDVKKNSHRRVISTNNDINPLKNLSTNNNLNNITNTNITNNLNKSQQIIYHHSKMKNPGISERFSHKKPASKLFLNNYNINDLNSNLRIGQNYKNQIIIILRIKMKKKMIIIVAIITIIMILIIK